MVLAAVLAMAMSVGIGSGTAHADPTGNESCGGSAWGVEMDWNNGAANAWNAWFDYKCGDGKTITWEVQHTTNGGATVGDWFGSGNESGFRSGPGCNNTCSNFEHHAGSCSSTGSYRLRINWAGGNWISGWVGAGRVCSGVAITF